MRRIITLRPRASVFPVEASWRCGSVRHTDVFASVEEARIVMEGIFGRCIFRVKGF